MHETANVLNCLLKSLQPKAKAAPHEAWMAETKAKAHYLLPIRRRLRRQVSEGGRVSHCKVECGVLAEDKATHAQGACGVGTSSLDVVRAQLTGVRQASSSTAPIEFSDLQGIS